MSQYRINRLILTGALIALGTIASGCSSIDRLKLLGETPPLSLRLANRAAYWLVFRNIRRMLGLDRCRIALTGAAPISPDLIRWYLALGIDMREVYGQTENCGVATMMPARMAPRPATRYQPLPPSAEPGSTPM